MHVSTNLLAAREGKRTLGDGCCSGEAKKLSGPMGGNVSKREPKREMEGGG